jgi:hypothetical protein
MSIYLAERSAGMKALACAPAERDVDRRLTAAGFFGLFV